MIADIAKLLPDKARCANENWRTVDVEDGFYSDSYLVSTKGQVFSIRRSIILKAKSSASGYLRITLSKEGRRRTFSVHRLVALAFIENPDNKPTVNHINEVKTDNRVENLEWATVLEQNVHGTRIERAVANTDWAARTRKVDYSEVARKHDYFSINVHQMKPVLQLDERGIVIARFLGIGAAARATSIGAGHICSCVKKKRRTAGGYMWRYA